jgi:hypothetical protein
MITDTSSSQVQDHSFISRAFSQRTWEAIQARVTYVGGIEVAIRITAEVNASKRLSVTDWQVIMEAMMAGDPDDQEIAFTIETMLYHHGYRG